MALSELKIKALKARDKLYTVRDSKGLYLDVCPSGSKLWRIRIHQDGRETRRSLGPYPDIPLKEAREKRDDLFRDRTRGGKLIEPVHLETFREVALDWHDRKVAGVMSSKYAEATLSRLKRFAFPHIGNMPINNVTAPDLLAFLRPVESAGKHETAHRTLRACGQVFRYGISIGVGKHDPCVDLRGALTPAPTNHFPSKREPHEIAELLQTLDLLSSSPIVHNALLLLALTFVRPGELRLAEWSEIDWEGAEWRIPAKRMKMKRLHIVPLSRQAIAILAQMKELTGHGRFVFPAFRSLARGDRAMSDGTMRAALQRLGYHHEFVPHGFRSMASTRLHEHGWPSDAVERQLAHVEGSAVKAAYNYAEHLEVRREMMQWWADYLDSLKAL